MVDEVPTTKKCSIALTGRKVRICKTSGPLESPIELLSSQDAVQRYLTKEQLESLRMTRTIADFEIEERIAIEMGLVAVPFTEDCLTVVDDPRYVAPMEHWIKVCDMDNDYVAEIVGLGYTGLLFYLPELLPAAVPFLQDPDELDNLKVAKALRYDYDVISSDVVVGGSFFKDSHWPTPTALDELKTKLRKDIAGTFISKLPRNEGAEILQGTTHYCLDARYVIYDDGLPVVATRTAIMAKHIRMMLESQKK